MIFKLTQLCKKNIEYAYSLNISLNGEKKCYFLYRRLHATFSKKEPYHSCSGNHEFSTRWRHDFSSIMLF